MKSSRILLLLVFLCAGLRLSAAVDVAVAPEAVVALRQAIASLAATFPDQYGRAPEFTQRLEAVKTAAEFRALQREALLASPLLEFDRLLVVRRGGRPPALPAAERSFSSLPQRPYDNEIALLTLSTGRLTPLFKPRDERFIGDVCLDFNAKKMLFSMPDDRGRWHVWQINADGTGLHRLTPKEPQVDQYDACYLPDGGMLFNSTATITGVPGSDHGMAGNLFRMDAATGNIRRLCFDAEDDGRPYVLDDGRVLYARGERGGRPRLFTMNPDGTGKAAYDGWQVPGTEVELDAAGQDAAGSWPQYRDPHPLKGNFFLVSGKTAPEAPWGVWLADLFGNRVLLCELPGQSLLEPQPFRPRLRPPVIPVQPVRGGEKTATVRFTDLYAGAGLAGVPRGTVKKMRVIARHSAYPGMGGRFGISVDGSPDVLRILGTVPVKGDGSVLFQVPANTPLAVQPLDGQGQAIRSVEEWFTAMPGETVSVGAAPAVENMVPAVMKWFWNTPPKPVRITPWHGPARGFSFKREVQPVLDKYCVNCHGIFSGDQPKKNGFDAAYLALHPFTRRPGAVADRRLPKPYEYHASTSELIQLLRAGHHGVRLDNEAWDRLITWIDLNVPDYGTWGERRPVPESFARLRREMLKKYAGISEDPEAYPVAPPARVKFLFPGVMPEPQPERKDWSFDVATVKGLPGELRFELGGGQTLEMVLVPADPPFYLGRCEVTNAQYRQFDPAHDSGGFPLFSHDRILPELPAGGLRQPVVRVSWQEASAFCDWLSEKTGRTFSLPDGERWEWACRAGASTSMWYGNMDADFSAYANLADSRLRQLLTAASPPWIPVVADADDGAAGTAEVGRYRPNPWGLYDMHGNAAEWTASEDGDDHKICRGGSFYDRPGRATAAASRAYPPWQPVFDVGFRVMCEPSAAEKSAK